MHQESDSSYQEITSLYVIIAKNIACAFFKKIWCNWLREDEGSRTTEILLLPRNSGIISSRLAAWQIATILRFSLSSFVWRPWRRGCCICHFGPEYLSFHENLPEQKETCAMLQILSTHRLILHRLQYYPRIMLFIHLSISFFFYALTGNNQRRDGIPLQFYFTTFLPDSSYFFLKS